MSAFADVVADADSIAKMREWLKRHIDQMEMTIYRDDRNRGTVVAFTVPEGPVRLASTGGEPDMQGFRAYREYQRLRDELHRWSEQQ